MAKKLTDTAKKAKSAKKTGTAKKTTKRTKISWIVKPDGMSLTEWQIALRKQIAQEEHFGISCVDDKLLPGECEESQDQAGIQGGVSWCEEPMELLFVFRLQDGTIRDLQASGGCEVVD